MEQGQDFSTYFEHLPHNQAAENNKSPILGKWQQLDLGDRHVIEVGSGTGQQGIFMCQSCSELLWQPTEIPDKFSLLTEWWQASQKAHLPNFLAPLGYVIGHSPFPDIEFNLVYSSNVLHIISRATAARFVEDATEAMTTGMEFVCYGPFKVDGEFTTESNAEFNDWLKQQGYGGILDIDDIIEFSGQQLQLVAKEPMPANNFLLVFRKK